MSMRAVQIKEGQGPVENLFLGEAPKPTAGKEEVLVKIKAFGLNRLDIEQRLGRYPPPPGASEILGVEFSGVIAEVGAGVESWKVGDEVMGLVGGGAYAEYISVPHHNVVPKPAHLSWAEAASIPENFLTAFQALVLVGQLKAGDDVLIHAGASGVGVAAIQLARFFKANTVTATASSTAKLNWLLSMPSGATHAVNYRTDSFADSVKATTNGKGVDVIIDFVGKTHWKGNIESLALDGRMTILSFLSGADVENVDLRPILYRRLKIQGSTLRSQPLAYQAALIERFAREALGAITGEKGDGAIRTNIHRVYPWTEIQAATQEMEENKNSGKIIAEIA